MSRGTRIAATLRSRRVAAYAVALSAVTVVLTLVTGGVAATMDSRRIEAVVVAPSPAGVSCLGRWCEVTWTVSATGGAVELERVVLSDLGYGAPDDGRRLLGVARDGESLGLPDRDDARNQERVSAIVVDGEVVPGDTTAGLTAVIAVAQQCPVGGFTPVRATVTVRSGGVVAQRTPEPVRLPCRG